MSDEINKLISDIKKIEVHNKSEVFGNYYPDLEKIVSKIRSEKKRFIIWRWIFDEFKRCFFVSRESYRNNLEKCIKQEKDRRTRKVFRYLKKNIDRYGATRLFGNAGLEGLNKIKLERLVREKQD